MHKKIAILGATSQIAQGIIYNSLTDKAHHFELFLFARDKAAVRAFLDRNGLKGKLVILKFKDFDTREYDVVINCVGIGSPAKLKKQLSSVFSLTEEFDNLILSYLRKFPATYYINFSSGAVYGGDFSAPAAKGAACVLPVNGLDQKHYYGIAKLNSEAKHRAESGLNIVDIRIFSYFSRFVSLDAGYFLTDIIRSLKENKEFVMDAGDFTRDYLHSSDLYHLLRAIIRTKPFNGCLDAYSAKPVTKSAILKHFKKEYGLRYRIARDRKVSSPTGSKSLYYSCFDKAGSLLGYKPRFSSLETIIQEARFLLKAYEQTR